MPPRHMSEEWCCQELAPWDQQRGLEAWYEELPGRIQGQGTQEVTNSSPLCPPQMPLNDLILSLKRIKHSSRIQSKRGGRVLSCCLTFALKFPHRELFLGLAPLGLTGQVPISGTLLLPPAREGRLLLKCWGS